MSELMDQLKASLNEELARGRSLNSIAVEAGLAQSSLWKFLHGQRGMSLGTAGRVARVLGLRLTRPRGNRENERERALTAFLRGNHPGLWDPSAKVDYKSLGPALRGAIESIWEVGDA